LILLFSSTQNPSKIVITQTLSLHIPDVGFTYNGVMLVLGYIWCLDINVSVMDLFVFETKEVL